MELLNEHQKLLMRRECRVVLGPHAVNLWLLTIVLTVTFLAIAFSSASTDYLAEKMNDPFTNWVNIDLSNADDETIKDLKYQLDDDSTQSRFGYDGVQAEVNSSLNFVDRSGRSHIMSTLFYETLSSDLITAVLSEENLADGCAVSPDSISEASLGVVVTADALTRLGYEAENRPAYIDYHSKSVSADTLGIAMLDDGIYARAPLPLLAVVKRLPMNKDAIASKYLNEVRIKAGMDCPIDLNHENYARELFYFVPQAMGNLDKERLTASLPVAVTGFIDEVLPQPQTLKKLRSWKPGTIVRVYVKPGTPLQSVNRLEREITAKFADEGIERIYNYDTVETMGNTFRDNVFSAHFNTLDSISAFENFVKSSAGIQIEMTQVNAKKNFWAVSQMAGVLTASMIVFAIISIVIFIVNMMQSYFQKVKRNLGTFKAFGVSTGSLITVYTLIILAIAVVALVISMLLVWIVQVLLPQRSGGYDYLNLWNVTTLLAVVVVLISVLVCVYTVMKRLLRSTPGDLIYDR